MLVMAMFAVQTTGAHAQDMCSKPYVACIDKCVGNPSPSMQDTCIGSCQRQNTSCSAKLYGGVNLSTAPTVTPEELEKREKAAQAKAGDKAAPRPARQMAAPSGQAERRPR
jgi:hypothetical protein